MTEKNDRKLKAALDETRLLILGVQILLGFEFQIAFQDGFETLDAASKHIGLVSLGLVLLAIALLIAPSMQHRLVEKGESTRRLIETTNLLAGMALAPLTLGLSAAVYLIVQRTFGSMIGAALGALLGFTAMFFWFGLEAIVGRHGEAEQLATSSSTPLKIKIEQLLTEARLIIPGGQALFGFQLIAMLTSGFDRLPLSAKIVHGAALCLVGLNIILLMTPAALHRLSFGGEDSPRFLHLGSAFVIAGPAFLAAGISAEIYVVFIKTLEIPVASLTAAIGAFFLITGLWYVWPLALRKSMRSAE